MKIAPLIALLFHPFFCKWLWESIIRGLKSKVFLKPLKPMYGNYLPIHSWLNAICITVNSMPIGGLEVRRYGKLKMKTVNGLTMSKRKFWYTAPPTFGLLYKTSSNRKTSWSHLWIALPLGARNRGSDAHYQTRWFCQIKSWEWTVRALPKRMGVCDAITAWNLSTYFWKVSIKKIKVKFISQKF